LEKPVANIPHKHHIDKRSLDLAAARAASVASPSEFEIEPLYSTAELAEALKVSVEFLESGRHRGYGPRYLKLSPHRIRYRRSDVIAWLEERSHQSTAEYESVGGRPRKVVAEESGDVA
jgi:hypothetical protein